MPPLDDFFANTQDITVENKSGCITDNAEISVLFNCLVLKNLFFPHPKAKLEKATKPNDTLSVEYIYSIFAKRATHTYYLT